MKDINRLKLHIQPSSGWINDPNGLCQLNGVYHIFYQYSLDPLGGNKAWGHKTTTDFIHWNTEEPKLLPDSYFDKDGVYSGSALIDENKMYLFYTGNVKEPGNHDYITTGRKAYTVMVESEDGIHFGPKKVVMKNDDYPHNYTCHIRDPKVWRKGDTYYMVQGGRRITNNGSVLLFASKDKVKWKFLKDFISSADFGYMWECPDYFEFDNMHLLSVSPQGLKKEDKRFQNIYQSGYIILPDSLDKLEGKIENTDSFTEWDMGFDFYAPQTFMDEKSRRILIGWAGIPDADYDNKPTVLCGWQHALTIPRKLSIVNGKVYQTPVEELLTLRGEEVMLCANANQLLKNNIFEIELTSIAACGEMAISCGDDSVTMSYNESGELILKLTKGCGQGRKTRFGKCKKVESIRAIVDSSLLEIYINEGEIVFTTRFYFQAEERNIKISGMEGKLYYLDEMSQN